MANQIKGKYIKDAAIDGSKFLLKNNDGLRAIKANGDPEVLLKLDSSDRLLLLKVPEVSVDASTENGLVRKSQLEAVVAIETSARQAAVTELSTRIDNVLSNVDNVSLNSLAEIVEAFQQADSSLDGAITSLATTEASARQAADAILQGNIDAEASARAAAIGSAIDAEASARAAADQALQDIINNLSPTLDGLSDVVVFGKADQDLIQWDSASGKWVNVAPMDVAEITSNVAKVGVIKTSAQGLLDDSFVSSNIARVSDVTAEASARQAAIESAVGAEASARASAITSAIDLEASARAAADQTLQNQINSILSNTDQAALDSLSEIVAAFQQADSDIDGAITSLATTEASARNAAIDAEASARNAAIDAEASARNAADGVLQSAIDSEASARQAADLAEQSLRSVADTLLQSNIDAEASARQAAVSEVQTNLTSLANSVDNALTTLDERVVAVEAVAVQFAKQKIVVTAMDISNGYVDLAHKIVDQSLVGSVDRLMIHQDDDYTLSVVNDLTRVTFVGNLVDPSEEKLADGDVLRFTYAYLAI